MWTNALPSHVYELAVKRENTTVCRIRKREMEIKLTDSENIVTAAASILLLLPMARTNAFASRSGQKIKSQPVLWEREGLKQDLVTTTIIFIDNKNWRCTVTEALFFAFLLINIIWMSDNTCPDFYQAQRIQNFC